MASRLATVSQRFSRKVVACSQGAEPRFQGVEPRFQGVEPCSKGVELFSGEVDPYFKGGGASFSVIGALFLRGGALFGIFDLTFSCLLGEGAASDTESEAGDGEESTSGGPAHDASSTATVGSNPIYLSDQVTLWAFASTCTYSFLCSSLSTIRNVH